MINIAFYIYFPLLIMGQIKFINYYHYYTTERVCYETIRNSLLFPFFFFLMLRRSSCLIDFNKFHFGAHPIQPHLRSIDFSIA